MTRSGMLSVYPTRPSACSPSSWPRFHHDIANSGDYTRDAIPPGVPELMGLRGHVVTVRAPGGDLMCGQAAAYELAVSRHRLSAQRFSAAHPVRLQTLPARAGSVQSLSLPRGSGYLALRAIDAAGNLGRPLVIRWPRAHR